MYNHINEIKRDLSKGLWSTVVRNMAIEMEFTMGIDRFFVRAINEWFDENPEDLPITREIGLPVLNQIMEEQGMAIDALGPEEELRTDYQDQLTGALKVIKHLATTEYLGIIG